MRNVVKIAVAGLLALAMMGAEDPGCAEKKDASTRPAEEQQVDKDKERRVSIAVHGDGPFTVIRTVTGPTNKGAVATEKQTREVAGGEYTAGYKYDSGVRLNIKVQVDGHPNDLFDCEIEDAVGGNRSYKRGRGQVRCEIWTQG